jgi:conjugative transposon TraJ protein
MKKNFVTATILVVTGQLLPNISFAQQFAGEIASFQSVLDQLYVEMLPLCSQLIDVGRGLAGFASMCYIASRVWRHIANAESVDFYPLLRPFALGLAVLLFPSVLSLMNSVLEPTVAGTASMVRGSNNSIAYLLKMKEEAIKKSPVWQMYVGINGNGDQDKWYRYTHPNETEEGFLDGIGNDIKFAMAKASYNFRNSIKQGLSEILHILYEAAALCVNTIRTFYLIVLAVLGPLVFGLSVFDGLQNTLTIWIARYINIFLWLPVANIFGSIIGKIQENMLKIDINQVNKYGDTFFSSTDTAYLIFMVIGIVGYFTVPSIANYIVHAAGSNPLLYKTTSIISTGANQTYSTAVGGASSLLSSKNDSNTTLTNPGMDTNMPSSPGNYMERKIAGK